MMGCEWSESLWLAASFRRCGLFIKSANLWLTKNNSQSQKSANFDSNYNCCPPWKTKNGKTGYLFPEKKEMLC